MSLHSALGSAAADGSGAQPQSSASQQQSFQQQAAAQEQQQSSPNQPADGAQAAGAAQDARSPQQSSAHYGEALADGHQLQQLQQHQYVSHGDMYAAQQQSARHQQAAAAAVQQSVLFPASSSNNKHLVEHAKLAIVQAAQDLAAANNAAQQHQQTHYLHSAPVHSSPMHYPAHPHAPQPNSGASYNSGSPMTASPSDISPNDAPQVNPYAAEGMQQQHQQQRYTHGGLSAHGLNQMHLQSAGVHQHSHSHSLHSPVNANQAFAQVLVAGLPPSLSQGELADLFSSLPAYERCGIACDPATGVSIGRGWLVFSSAEAAGSAIAKMSGVVVAGHPLSLSMMQPIGESTKSNIYVAGLPKQYTQSQLEQLFGTFGSIIESKILTDPQGSSRGVAFVRYDNSNSAAQAITAVNGHVMADGLHTYTIRVKFARDHHRNADPTLAMLTGAQGQQGHASMGQPRTAAIYQSYIPPHIKARGDDISGGVALFVFHIPAEFTSRDLQELFAPCATVLSARIAIHPQTLESKGFGFVSVASMEEAHQAVTLLNGRRVGRKFIKVSFKKAAAGDQQQQHRGGQQHTPGNAHHGSHSQHGRQSHHVGLDTSVQNLSNLAAALNLGGYQLGNQANLSNFSGSWAGSTPQTPSSPSLLNYNVKADNSSYLPLQLLMQQMQLNSNQSFVSSQYGQTTPSTPQQNSQQHSYNAYSPNALQQQAAVNASWMPPSPISLPLAAGGNYSQQQQQPQQGQMQQQVNGQQLFM